MTSKECLLVGSENAGKSLLLYRLKWLSTQNIAKKETASKEHSLTNIPEPPSLLPTVGTVFETVKITKEDNSSTKIKLRELGGAMAPIWYDYYKGASLVMYVIDMSDHFRLSASTILLLDVLAHEDLQGKPTLIIFNKSDLSTCLSFEQLKAIMRLDDLLSSRSGLQYIRISSLTCDGLEQVLKWITIQALK